MRRQTALPPLVIAFWATVCTLGHCVEPAEPLLEELRPGLFLKSTTVVPEEQTKAIGEKLGGKIERLTNSFLVVHSRNIQVNVVTAADDKSAESLHAGLSKIKPYPYCLRKERMIVEYVGQQVDEALAIKTSYELGLRERPSRIRYRIEVDLAAVDKADSASSNTLFNLFLALQLPPRESTIQQIEVVRRHFTFGKSLAFRNPEFGNPVTIYRFQPKFVATEPLGSAVRYSFDSLPQRQEIPYVGVTIETTVNATGFTGSKLSPAKELTNATAAWPSDDPRISALARRITEGQDSNEGKVNALLAWLRPGKNIKYSGRTGSRWGTAKVFEQKFGHCWDFADCFVTFCRAVDVPCRQVAGWLYGSSGHVWAEFYVEDKGWQQVDPTGGGVLPCGLYHVPYFSTDDGEMPLLYLSMPKIDILEES